MSNSNPGKYLGHPVMYAATTRQQNNGCSLKIQTTILIDFFKQNELFCMIFERARKTAQYSNYELSITPLRRTRSIREFVLIASLCTGCLESVGRFFF
jgi:hypothetical protein